MESEDYDFYKGLVFLLENNVEELGYDLTFSTEVVPLSFIDILYIFSFDQVVHINCLLFIEYWCS